MSNVIFLEMSCFGLASALYFAQNVTSGASKVTDTGPLLALARIEAPGPLGELYQLVIIDSIVYIPRLIARDAYRHPLPPDPWENLLRADLRFVIGKYDSVSLAEKLVDDWEREGAAPPDPYASPRPRGDRRRTRSDAARKGWGAYLFDRGMDHMWAGWPLAAEAYYREALRLDPGHADAWVHLGNRRFEEDHVSEALALYERGQAAAEARPIGDPERYPDPFWLDVDSRPFMRALHGRGLCLWRLGRVAEARQVFTRMLELNPNDNQGARFLLYDLDGGLSWEESLARDQERMP
jgi:tetratricopeptide (TPR) repeat protein